MTWPIAICLAIGGVLVGRLWSDIANAYKYARADRRAELRADAHAHLLNALPRWLIAFVIVTGVVTIVIGGAQVWQAHQFTNYQSCQATHDQEYDDAQQARAKANLSLTKKRFEYDQSVLALFDEKNQEHDVQITQKLLKQYIDAATDYFKTVEENPVPESTVNLCGTPKG